MVNIPVERGYLTESLGRASHSGEHGLKTVPGLLRLVLEKEAWKERIIIATGEQFPGFPSFEAYVKANPPRGLGASIEVIDRLLADDEDLRAQFYTTLGRPGAETNRLYSHSYEFERTSNDIQIRDGMHEVHLSFDGALTLLQWLYEMRGELTRLMHPEIAEPQKVPLYDDIPDFTEQEALLLCDVLHGVRCTPSTLHGNVAAAVEPTLYAGINAFLARINALSDVQAQAVIDAVALFWRGPYGKTVDAVYRSLYEVGLVKQEQRPARWGNTT